MTRTLAKQNDQRRTSRQSMWAPLAPNPRMRTQVPSLQSAHGDAAGQGSLPRHGGELRSRKRTRKFGAASPGGGKQSLLPARLPPLAGPSPPSSPPRRPVCSGAGGATRRAPRRVRALEDMGAQFIPPPPPSTNTGAANQLFSVPAVGAAGQRQTAAIAPGSKMAVYSSSSEAESTRPWETRPQAAHGEGTRRPCVPIQRLYAPVPVAVGGLGCVGRESRPPSA
jgi:hypothetical protein